MTKQELPPTARKALGDFLAYIGVTLSIHPSEWSKFYNFIRVCSANRVKISDQRLKEILIERGLTEKTAYELANVYYHGIRILGTKLPTYAKSWEAYYIERATDLSLRLHYAIEDSSKDILWTIEALTSCALQAKQYQRVVTVIYNNLIFTYNDNVLPELETSLSTAIAKVKQLLN